MIEKPAIEIKNISVIYNEGTPNEVIVFHGFSLTVKKGEVLVITGGNGSGKSTLLNAIAGTIPVKSGQIFINGTNVTGWSSHRRAKLLGFVFQDTMLGVCPNLSVQENFQLTMTDKWFLPIPYKLKMSEKQHNSIKRIGLGLESRPLSKVNTFSGGQRQAISICLAFENRKDILLFDEFTSALDEKTSDIMLKYTFEKAKENNSTVLLVMHNIHNALKYTDNYLKLKQL